MVVQYAIHLLEDLPKRDCSLASRTALGNNHVMLERRDNKSVAAETCEIEDWMDGPLEGYSKYYLRNTMLNQEKVFNEQVLELHRLYHVQRALMSGLNNELGFRWATTATLSSGVGSDPKSDLWSSTSDSRTSLLSRFVDRTINSAQRGPCRRVSLESKVVFPCSTVEDRPPHPIYQEHTCVAEKTEDNNLDLTLSIGSTSSRAKARKVEPAESTSYNVRRAIPSTSNHGMPWMKEHVHASHVFDFHSPGAGLQQGPPWLSQALSLNRA